MDEIKANLVALVEGDADIARTRAQRLRLLAKFIAALVPAARINRPVLLRSYSSRYLERTLSSFPEPWDTITLRSLSGLEVFAGLGFSQDGIGWLRVQTGCVAP